ncbi:MAG: hypothetical protein OXR73_24300 [Myxococcales bacterium]|nr:hypothetical protein [Myxococcales bacterium]
MIGGAERALLAVLLLVLMTGMGATLRLASFRDIMKAPRGVLIGLASQFGWMPLLAFNLAKAMGLPNEMAVGLIIVGCTPGGTTSNMFTYYGRADLALSISMTVVSTVVALAAMPALLWLYATPFTDEHLRIPFGSIGTTLALVLLPVGLGMFIRTRSETSARRAERLGSLAGLLVLVLLVGTSLWRNADSLAKVPMLGYVASIGLGTFGMALGYLVARLLGLSVPARRAISLETGIQNSPLAFAIIIGSFPDALHERMLWLPMAYALFVLMSASCATWYFRRKPVAVSSLEHASVGYRQAAGGE